MKNSMSHVWLKSMKPLTTFYFRFWENDFKGYFARKEQSETDPRFLEGEFKTQLPELK